MPKAYSSDFFGSAAVCLSKIVQMYASASKSLNFFWKLSLADSVSAFGALRSFLTNLRSAALVFLFAGYFFFPGIPDGFFPHVD